MEATDAVFKGAKLAGQCGDAKDIPDKKYDLGYIDPPYLTKTGDNETSATEGPITSWRRM